MIYVLPCQIESNCLELLLDLMTVVRIVEEYSTVKLNNIWGRGGARPLKFNGGGGAIQSVAAAMLLAHTEIYEGWYDSSSSLGWTRPRGLR